MAVLTRREVDEGVRATLRLLSKVDSCPFFRSRFKQSKEGFNLRSKHLETNESQVDEKIFRFRSGQAVSIISE